MSFAPRAPGDVVALIAAHPLAWVVSRDFDATPLPLLAECDKDGALVALFGHYARRNPQVAAFAHDPSALILFGGPQGYVSPRLVTKPGWGPTWNYAVLRITADVAFVPGETDAALRRLAAQLEPGGTWRVEEMGERYTRLAEQVIAFRATVRSVEAVFKLGQDEEAETFEEIVRGHVDRGLAQAMLAQQGDARH